MDVDGAPLVRIVGKDATLWIRLTVCGVTRLGVGSVSAQAFERDKQLIGDAIRNAAMRFGVALDLWSKEELSDPGEQSIPVQRPQAKTAPDLKPGWDNLDEQLAEHLDIAARIKARPDHLRETPRQFKLDHGWPLPADKWIALDQLVAEIEAQVST